MELIGRLKAGSSYCQANRQEWWDSSQPCPAFLFSKRKVTPEVVQCGRELLGQVWYFMLQSELSHTAFLDAMTFFGISRPFCELKYKKVMEFEVEKHSQGRFNDHWYERAAKKLFKRWQRRWIVIAYNSISYYKNAEDKSWAMRDSIALDCETELTFLGCDKGRSQIEIAISRRLLTLEVLGCIEGLIAMHYIVEAIGLSYYTKKHRFFSFAPIRENNDCAFFADGKGYFEAVFSDIEQARSDILICDWWLSPELPLIRPIQGDWDTEPSRVDLTLKRAADRGVKIYILLYKEFHTLGNQSKHAKKVLESLSPNIKVIRHPKTIVSLWAHHEKMVIVDKSICFLGGLDLCWGRFDGNDHPLFNNKEKTIFPGIDYTNDVIKDISNKASHAKQIIPDSSPRLPWHDTAVRLRGKIVSDYVNHFILYWNHARESAKEGELLYNQKLHRGESSVNLVDQAYISQTSALNKSLVVSLKTGRGSTTHPSSSLLRGSKPEVTNIDTEDQSSKGGTDEESLALVILSRLISLMMNQDHPKHLGSLKTHIDKQIIAAKKNNREISYLESTLEDIYTSVEGIDPVKVRYRSKKRQSNILMTSIDKSSRMNYDNLFDTFDDDGYDLLNDFKDNAEIDGIGKKEKNEVFGDFDESYRLPVYFGEDEYGDSGKFRMQALRSSSEWSSGKRKAEASIYQAYLHLIDSAERCVYIENQFFICSTEAEGGSVENKIAMAIFARIKRAFEKNQPFRVIIILPLLPGFKANFDKMKGALLQISLGLHQRTIGQGQNSLIGKLLGLLRGSNLIPEDYLLVCGLRTYDRRSDSSLPVTEQIYVHSKVCYI